MDVDYELIIYDQCTTQPTLLSSDCFLVVLIEKLVQEFTHVFLLKGIQYVQLSIRPFIVLSVQNEMRLEFVLDSVIHMDWKVNQSISLLRCEKQNKLNNKSISVVIAEFP